MSWGSDIDNTWPWWQPYNPFGYYNLGPVQIPPIVPYVGMTDRSTGKLWYLCFDPKNGNRLSLTDQKPTFAALRTYAAFDGPYIGSYGLRLGVDSSSGTTRLVFDNLQPMNGGNCPIGFQLNTGSTQYAVLEAKSVKNPNQFDHLAYEVLLRQPPNPTGANQALPGEP